jgi:hypothetical protein
MRGKLKWIFLFIITMFFSYSYSQSDYLNDDFEISNKTKREYIIDMFNNLKGENNQYEEENNFFVIISKIDCENRTYSDDEMQQRAVFSSFNQALDNITRFRNAGYKTLSDLGFVGIIFKTNTICMGSTRRYHFKFSFLELTKLPNFLDYNELVKYVENNQYKNVILVKNPR